MRTVEEALELVRQQVTSAPSVRVAASEALGRTLAEDIASDVDSPPYDKALVDGYAVVAADCVSGTAQVRIVEEVMAGQVPTRPIGRGETTRVMTGAPLPEGADAAVMVERSQHIAADDGSLGEVILETAGITPGRNIMRRGESMRRNDVVLHQGHTLRPIEIGLLAEVGRTEVEVIATPRVAVLSTGDEVVPADVQPGPGQIRNSNGPLLCAAVQRAGGLEIGLGIAPDRREGLAALIRKGLEADVLVLSGGVSAGVLDLVPAVLDSLGVREVFHKVRLKPGKPIWFGTLPGESRNKLVFGLPGNPVSSLVCFELFVRPALQAIGGGEFATQHRWPARLAGEFEHRGDRPTYYPGAIQEAAEGMCVTPLAWRGSADLYRLSQADALICFPAGDAKYPDGTPVSIIRI